MYGCGTPTTAASTVTSTPSISASGPAVFDADPFPLSAVQPLLDQSLSAWLAAGPASALPLAVRARELAVHERRVGLQLDGHRHRRRLPDHLVAQGPSAPIEVVLPRADRLLCRGAGEHEMQTFDLHTSETKEMWNEVGVDIADAEPPPISSRRSDRWPSSVPCRAPRVCYWQETPPGSSIP